MNPNAQQTNHATYPNADLEKSNNMAGQHQAGANYYQQAQYDQYSNNGQNQVHVVHTTQSSGISTAFILMIVGFFFPIVHLVNACMHV